MRIVIACALAASFTLGLASCDTAQKSGTSAAAAETAKCSMCSQTYEWSYSSKPWLDTKKTVSHTCPMCKMAWNAGLAKDSACAECAKAELACPKCQAAGKK